MTDPILLDLPACIETERLMLRPPQAGDGVLVHAAVSESLPELRRFLASLPWVAAEPSAAASESFCRTAQANFLARRDFTFLIFDRHSREHLGNVGLHRTDWATPKTEVGYWVRSSKAGRGFVTEAVNGLVGYAFERLGMVRVELVTDEENTASRRVAERAGFSLEGLHRHERRAPDGSLRNTCVYARLRPAADSPPELPADQGSAPP